MRRFGIDLRRWTPRNDPGLRVFRAISAAGAEVVIDIGANCGQFAQSLRRNGYEGKIVSVEPLGRAHRELCQAARGDGQWDVYQRTAVGSRDEQVLINVASNSVSSSVLPINQLHVAAEPRSCYVGSELIGCTTLDHIFSTCGNGKRVFVKIDVQGYEGEVLLGGKVALHSCVGVLCETSIRPLYEGGVEWLDVLAMLQSFGLRLWSVEPGFSHPVTGEQYQVDLLLIRPADTADLPCACPLPGSTAGAST